MSTMIAEQFIQAYQAKIRIALQERDEWRKGIEERALTLFEQNCRIWLGELWQEFQPDNPRLEWSKNEEQYQMFLPFTWQGIRGNIWSGWIGDRDRSNWKPDLILWIRPYAPGYSREWKEGLKLPFEDLRKAARIMRPDEHSWDGLEYTQSAVGMPNAVALGQLLAIALEAKEKHEQAVQAEEEQRRNNEINRLRHWFFEADGDGPLVEHLTHCMEKYPELAETWQELAGQARERIADHVAREEAKEAEEREKRAEHDRLEGLIETQFRPCTIYEVLFGAESNSDGYWYTQTAYTTTMEPDADGWWTELVCAQEKRVRLPHVLKVTEIRLEKYSDVPYEVCSSTWQQSEKFPDVYAETRKLPAFLMQGN